MSNRIEKKIKIGDFFNNNITYIPIIQRDYAQGRQGKETIRETFLKDISEAVKDNGNAITLDFVYGYKENGVFYPLDGQQRLTTLWLVYWYLSVKAGKLEDEKKNLLKFSYQTRKSSREFCQALCSNEISLDRGIVEYIEKQKWFFSSWKKDPTISSMLRTLGGTNGEDGIEPIFGKMAVKINKWSSILDKFKEKISFFVLEINNDALPREIADKLYIKMNARGKALTDFENFKADLINKINKDIKDESIKEVSKKIDNSWNDIFWNSTNAFDGFDGKIDEIFFAFFNRFCFNQLCLLKDTTTNEYPVKPESIKRIDEILAENVLEKYNVKKTEEISEKQWLSLFLYFSKDVKIKYEKFDYYNKLLNKNGLTYLNNVLDRVKDNIDTIKSELDQINNIVQQREKGELENINKIVQQREKGSEKGYCFLPVYKVQGNKKITNKDDNGNKIGLVDETTQKERIYFFAICKYLNDNKSFIKENFSSWMRFCRNVIENSGIDSVSAMISVIRKLNEFESTDILDFLRTETFTFSNTKLDKQISEEQQKAKKIQEAGWEDKIIEAENTQFLCGKICFLFTNEGGLEDNEGGLDWVNFDIKLKNFNEFFQGSKATFDFVKNYASMFEDFEDVQEKLIFHTIGWQRRGESWLDTLCDEGEKERVHAIFTGEKSVKAEGNYKSFVKSETFKCVVEKTSVFENKDNLRVAWPKNSYALYKKKAQDEKLHFDYEEDNKIYFKRNEIISDLRKIENFVLGEKQEIVKDEAYYFGDDITFTYKDINYIWSSDDCIYLVDKTKKNPDKIIEKTSTFNIDEIKEELDKIKEKLEQQNN